MRQRERENRPFSGERRALLGCATGESGVWEMSEGGSVGSGAGEGVMW